MTMTDVKPGQIWERQSMPNAPWRPVEVVNVLFDQVELRFLDMPDAPDLSRTFSTSTQQMLSGRFSGAGAKYRFIREK
jgi:hypothetical protein